MKSKIMSWQELCEACYKHNEENNITRQYDDKHPLKCFVVIKQMPYWKKQYTKLERTYTFVSSEKRFIGGLCGNSIFASCLGYEDNIRLDYYLGDWEFEECWYEEDE